MGSPLIFEHSCSLPRRGIICPWATARDTLDTAGPVDGPAWGR
jgi:hypothetical protein